MIGISLFAVILLKALLVNANGIYTVVCPGTIRSNSKYNVAVTIHKADNSCQIKVTLSGPSFNETKEIEVPPKFTKNLEFQVPQLAPGNYQLIAQGVSGVEFRETSKLNYADGMPSTFVQTDKATYKPADLVQFRVFFLDEKTRPAQIDKPISVVITDGAQNRIKQFTDVKLTKGVYSGELQLSEQPVLGTWKISVSVDGNTMETKTFEVDKYVLPKFEVIIDTAKDVLLADEVVKATIRAKYTHGKPVKGKATISMEPTSLYYHPKVGKTIDLDGKGHVEFKVDSRRLEYYEKIFATVTEELTGKQINSTATVHLHRKPYQITVLEEPDYFQRYKPFVYQVAVKKFDGSPVVGSAKNVTLAFKRYNKPHLTFEAPLNDNGIATFTLTPTRFNSDFYFVYATYDGVEIESKRLYRSNSNLSEQLRIQINTKSPRLGHVVSFDVKSPNYIPYFVFTIVARGNIVLTQYINVPMGQKTRSATFTPTFEMLPTATIYIHYVVNNRLHFEEQSIEFEKEFINSIDISAPLNARPSERVKLTVKTDADSFVGLLGVDQSVLLHKSGNDLSRDNIFNGLKQKYQTSRSKMYGYEKYPGKTSGLVTLTNANYDDDQWNSEDCLYGLFGSWYGRRCRYIRNWNRGRPNRRYYQTRVMPAFPDDYEIDYLVAPKKSVNPVQVPRVNPKPKSKPPPPVRKEFPETWLFTNSVDVNGEGFTLTKKVPDTITSWVVTGFSLNPTSGIALTKTPSQIRVFQPFFVSTNLPYSVKRGEVIAVPVLVFNYLDKAVEAEVVMDNSDHEYEFTEATNEVLERAIDEVRRVKRITIPENTGQSVSFMIRPKNVGYTTLKITATSPLAGDTIHQKLKVEPEGVTQFENRAIFINLKDQSEISQSLEAEIPAEAVPQSEFIEFSVMGDLLGPTLQNLDNLVRMPYGCGEQNMINFVPNILVLKYLEVTGRSMPAIEAKARKFLEIGYQRELTYKHDDGSYSAFGKSDSAGSTWLTAYVMRSFHQAANYTQVDSKVVTAGFDFLVSKQRETGEFPELGKLFDNSKQNALALTSYVLLAFFENNELISKYQSAIDKAVGYVAQKVDQTEDQYSLAIAGVALQLAKHPQAEKVLTKLQEVARSENGMKWWSKTPDTSRKTRSNDVEITSYVLLALLEKEPAEKALPIIKWLISQRNSKGGFSSTQDTVIGLQALTKFASKAGSGSGTMDIEFVASPDGGSKEKIAVNSENALILQTHVLPKTTRKVDFTAKGSGSAMVQFSYRYNLAEKEKKPSFKVTPTVKESPSQLLVLDICAEYIPLEDGDKDKDSNMAVMEIALPSGFVGDLESLGKIKAVDRVKRVETKHSDSKVVVYFDSLTPGDVRCLPVEASKAHPVAKQKPASVSLYDYYDTERRATEYYQVQSSLCDICEGSDCGEGCQKA
ncbi:thioester-containing protein 1 allele S3-like [Drosophila kikkawai]|uniref:CD109 antigen n=1 Tax=Drosophila kikkawai TaxID=30033 RepID=A0A6P4J215_DROKI|nr:CD109 antigen-like [Drosophila kikkawai]